MALATLFGAAAFILCAYKLTTPQKAILRLDESLQTHLAYQTLAPPTPKEYQRFVHALARTMQEGNDFYQHILTRAS